MLPTSMAEKAEVREIFFCGLNSYEATRSPSTPTVSTKARLVIPLHRLRLSDRRQPAGVFSVPSGRLCGPGLQLAEKNFPDLLPFSISRCTMHPFVFPEALNR